MSGKSIGLKNSKTALDASIRSHVLHSLGKEWKYRDHKDLGRALALSLRDRLVEAMLETRDRYRTAQAKRMYYLSIEYLLGRCLGNNLYNLNLYNRCKDLFEEYGADIDETREAERDPALGNGGLGRLAACFLDSLASLDLPGCGYGIHYEYGLFRQDIRDGEQVERPDYWMADGMPLQIERKDQFVMVPLYGRVEQARDANNDYLPMWLDWKDIIGVPYDVPIAGYGGKTVNYLRLFAAKSSHNFDMQIFNHGDYVQAIHQKVQSELVSKVLYPSESISFGKELRLVQEYFLAACSLRDIMRRFLKQNKDLTQLPDFVAVQLNDTHPALAVAELMRMLVDEHRLGWDLAFDLTRRTCAYTNHTLMSEALETWSVDLVGRVLPRHLQIIFEINRRFLEQIRLSGAAPETVRRVSLVQEAPSKKIRMANLAVVGSHSVNGVSALHTELVKKDLFPEFFAMWPERFNNKTNGVTPRRWLYKANPGLSDLLCETIGEGWIMDLEELRKIEPLADDTGFQDRFMGVKLENKRRLARLISRQAGVAVDPEAMFDVQAKRIHEYKRQLLNALHIIHLYLQIVDHGAFPESPRVCLFAGKAAPGYWEAKQIIKLINYLARVINADLRAKDHLRVAFLPDYRVSLAEKLIPAADLSEQISTAGTEASGTGNMKFALNGALTIGTLDGANVEMRQEIGQENIYIFGLRTEEVAGVLSSGAYRPREIYKENEGLREVLDALAGDRFSPGQPGLFGWIKDKLLWEGERYLHAADFMDYLRVQHVAGEEFQDNRLWARKAILNAARIGAFSSDRTIREYARDIWGIKAVPPKGMSKKSKKK
ncbi:MAG: glycogen/starch/alpha-glucan phosphorylase [Desulfovibrionaceae bacterium]